MSITVTNPVNNPADTKPGTPQQQKQKQKIDPSKAMEMNRLKRQQDTINKRMERLKKAVISKYIEAAPPAPAQAPAETLGPADLNIIIKPVLSAVRIKIQDNKTELVEKTTPRMGKVLYHVVIRRDTVLDNTMIQKIYSNLKTDFDRMVWSSTGIDAYVWAPLPE